MGRSGALIAIAAIAVIGLGAWMLMDGDAESPYEEWEDSGFEDEERRALLRGAGTGDAPEALHAEVGATGFSIPGRVYGADGEPAAGVTVSAFFTSPVWHPSEAGRYYAHNGPDAQMRRRIKAIDHPKVGARTATAEVTSGEDGRFEFEHLRRGSYEIQAVVEAPLWSTYASTSIGQNTFGRPLNLHLTKGTPLSGRVLDHADRPVTAVVRASWNETIDGAKRRWHSDPLRAGKDGAFQIPSVPDGKLSFSVTIDGLLTLRGINVETPTEETVVLRVPGGDGVIFGTVSDTKEQDVAGAELVFDLEIKNDEGQTPLTYGVKTMPDGGYRLEGLPAGKITQVRILADGYVPLQETPPLAVWSGAETKDDSEREIDFVLMRGGRVHGVVTADDTGEPLADAHVQLFTANGNSGIAVPPRPTRTDRQGRFVFEGVASGRLIIIASHATHYLAAIFPAQGSSNQMMVFPGQTNRSPAELTIVMPEDGATVKRDLKLTPGYTIQGIVVGPDATPIADASVHLKNTNGMNMLSMWGIGWWNSTKEDVRSDADGRFIYTALPAREGWQLYAKKEGFCGQYCDPVDLGTDMASPDVELALLHGATVKGTIKGADGDPISGAHVNLWNQDQQLAGSNTYGQTDDEGNYEIKSLPKGSYQMWVNMPNYGQAQQMRVEDLETGEVREGVDIELTQGVEVSGQLLDSDGDPVPNTALALQAQTGGWHQTNTDSEGEFTFANAPEGSCSVQIQQGNQWTQLGKRFESPTSGLELTWDPPPTQVIAGRVVAPDGTPIPLCTVTVSAKGGGGNNNMGWSPGYSPNEAVNGTFRRQFTGEAPITIKVAGPRDREGQPMNLLGKTETLDELPTEPVVIKLEGGGEVTGRVTDTGGRPVAGVRVVVGGNNPMVAGIDSMTDEDGRFVLAGLKGSATLSFTPPSGFVNPGTRKVEVGKSVEVTLQPGLAIKGVVFKPDGGALSQGWINANWKAVGETKAGNANAQVQGGGKFEIQGLPEGVLVTLTVNAGWTQNGPKFAPVTLSDIRPGTEDLEIELGDAVSIQGTVTDADGKAVTQGWVFAKDPDGKQTGGYSQIQSGKFTLAGLKPGVVYKLGVHRQSGTPSNDLAEVAAPATGIAIQLPQEKKISGHIAGDPGVLKGFWVRARSTDGKQNARGQVQEDGTWTVSGVSDGTQWLIRTGSREDERYGESAPVEPGATDVEIHLKKGRAISGTLLTEGGDPAKQSWVMAKGQGDVEGWDKWGRTDEDGNFSIPGLPPGSYDLTGMVPGQSNKELRKGVGAGESGIELQM